MGHLDGLGWGWCGYCVCVCECALTMLGVRDFLFCWVLGVFPPVLLFVWGSQASLATTRSLTSTPLPTISSHIIRPPRDDRNVRALEKTLERVASRVRGFVVSGFRVCS